MASAVHLDRIDSAPGYRRVALALEETGTGRLAIGGGVAANGPLRERLGALGAATHTPAPELCTDNAAMIALAGAERLRLGFSDDLSFPARPRWPLDGEAARLRPSHQAGRKGAKA